MTLSPSDNLDAGEKIRFKRILLKLSGEVLTGDKAGKTLDHDTLERISKEIVEAVDLGVEVGVVIGGGNIFRGLSASSGGMDRVCADHIGMLATVINSLALSEYIDRKGKPARVMSSVEMVGIAEAFVHRKSLEYLDNGCVVIFAGGTGNPFFTTDTAAALRASEIKAQVMLKGTKVDGVYDKDPLTNPDAIKYNKISYLEVLSGGLKVMDATAISMCMDSGIPIVVFDICETGNLKRIILGEQIGTLVV